MSKLIEIKHRNTGKVLFSNTYEGNTVAKCLRYAHLLKHDVRHADLAGADLSHGHFVGIDLTGADLRGAKLNSANFFTATLDGANLSNTFAVGINLEGAKLHRTTAKNANFTSAWFKDAMSMEGNFQESIFDHGVLLNFMTRGCNFKNISTKATLLDDTDTRIGYKWDIIQPVNVCEQEPCQQCVGCESPKKFGAEDDNAKLFVV
jgi:uncharacterized protein YjbI with pentapeptide repeats